MSLFYSDKLENIKQKYFTFIFLTYNELKTEIKGIYLVVASVK